MTTYVAITYVMPDAALLRRLTTQKTTTTYVTKHSSYAPTGERQGFTVARSSSSIGHCEKAAKAVRAAAGSYRALVHASCLGFLVAF